ncbi:MAG TPA: SDR family NAD(P)-dependent oxidoreductase [Acidimicrobiales bacterium]|nr:SDR family NAD(P)-dependent oxidoreductase [Acidimicrobiales bacterium]
MIDFRGQAVVVTGAGRGLGRLYALELARRGADVVVNDLGGSVEGTGTDASVADGVVGEIRRAGGSALASHDSVDTPEGGEAIVHRALDAFGRLDAVVSNGGWPVRVRRLLGGPVRPAQRAHYAAVKAGVMGLANVIAIEGKPHGILANTVLPFGCSPMVTSTLGEEAAEELRRASGFMQAIEPELVVPVVVYLASTACGLTHHNYSACAGRFARVFVGLGEDWLAPPGSVPTADDVADHLAELAATEPFVVPTSIFDEVAQRCERLGITVCGPRPGTDCRARSGRGAIP